MDHDKLVRDKIPELLSARGIRPVTHLASDREYAAKLVDKLSEEMEEFRAGGELEELADLLEVIYAVAEARGVGEEQLNAVRLKKARERGTFTRRIILEATEP